LQHHLAGRTRNRRPARQAPCRTIHTSGSCFQRPEPPFLEREFVIEYDFDSDFLFARNTRQLTDIAEYARVSGAQTVEVIGYRASTLLSSGDLLTEKPNVSRLRAERVAEVLKGLGAPASAVRWISEPAAANGATDFENRRVVVRVSP
jgi:outer membrane protein OmpA-like peptidoglycan-associated protein